MTTSFRALRCAIKTEWLSAATSHLFIGNYVVLLNEAAGNFLAAQGLDQGYKDTHGHAHVAGGLSIRYEREIFVNEIALIDIILADMDEKRVHLAAEFFREGDPKRICCAELLFINTSRATHRATPWAPALAAQFMATKAAHAALPRPQNFGQPVGLKRAS